MTLLRLHLLAVALLAGAFALLRCDGGDAGAACPDCNVVLITFDALRADHLGAYGYPLETSPRLDALAERSTVFLRNVSQSGSTLSSLPSLLTGRFPHVDRLIAERGRMRASEHSLARVLAAAGYHTMAVIAQRHASCEWGMCDGFAVVDEDYVRREKASRTAERVGKMLARGPSEPFFLWVHFLPPHEPYDPAPEIFELFYSAAGGEPTHYSLADRPLRSRLIRMRRYYMRQGENASRFDNNNRRDRLTPSMLRQVVAMYDGNIREADNAFAAILEQLDEAGWLSRTVLVVGADHAESLGENGIIGHNELDYGILRTPLIVHVPGLPPRQDDAPAMNVDILPTILATIGVDPPPGLRGRALLAPGDGAGRLQYAEYSGRWTAIEYPWQLLVAEDPPRKTQLVDLSQPPQMRPQMREDASAQQPDVAARLGGARAALEQSATPEAAALPDAQVLERLRELGYIRD